MSRRLQTCFPFEVQICLNAREWLSRQMDRVGMSYSRQENGFLWVEDFPAARELMDEQIRFAWAPALELVACRLNPVHEEIFRRYPVEYYWSVHQSEWASDLVFRSSQALAEIYPQLVRSGIGVFSSPDVMRFLGKRLHPNFSGEIISDYKNRPEGIRVKHRVGANAVKMYDKFGRILRVETTLNDPKPIKVFRPLEGNPQGRHAWRPMRKGIADLARRAEISQACNDRYLEALAALRTDRPIQQLIDPVCRTVVYKGRRGRALRPWEPADQRLLQVISRGEFSVNGVRNRDLLPYLFPEAASSAEERRRASARVTRKLRLLRAHGIIRKVAKTHRYLFTKKGRRIATAILEYQKATLEQLSELAA